MKLVEQKQQPTAGPSAGSTAETLGTTSVAKAHVTRRQGRRRRHWSLSRLIYSARDEQLRYLSQSARLEEGLNPRLTKLTALCISLSVLAFIGWAGVTNINEIARTPGEIVPLGFEQTVQHLDGGIVAEIHAEEGTMVERGQLLVLLDGGGTSEDLRRAERKQWALEIQAERLRAFVERREPDFSSFGDAGAKGVVEQQAIFDTMVLARSQQTNIVQDQVKQKQQDLQILRTRKATVEDNLQAVEDLFRRYKTLYDKGHLSYVKLSQTQQQLNSLLGERSALEEQIRQAEVAIDEFENRLGSLGTAQKDDIYRELHEVEAELTQNEQIIEKMTRRVERLSVRAPVRGIVKGLAVNTIGGVVQPGQALMSIVPLDERLVVETRISPLHIGHVKVGQAVQIKVSAYDFARYGALAGRLEFISATTFKSDEQDRYYRGRIVFDQDYVGSLPGRNPILPGMTVMAEIITGERTILEYLLKPVHQAIATAFSER